MASVNQNGFALQFASDGRKNEFKIVMVAVNEDAETLRFVSHDLQNDLLVVVLALASRYCLRWVGEKYREYADYELLPSNYFKQEVGRTLANSTAFIAGFLPGMSKSSAKCLACKRSKSCCHPSGCCELSRLARLGKYDSIHIKKRIAKFVGAVYGRDLQNFRKAARLLCGE